jgi:hypothetical protein
VDDASDLSCKDGTGQHPVDGWGATHNRSVAGSRPASPTESRRSQAAGGQAAPPGRHQRRRPTGNREPDRHGQPVGQRRWPAASGWRWSPGIAVLWEGRPLQLKDIEAIGDTWPAPGCAMPTFFAALGGTFDRGHWSYEDVDLAVLTVPTLLSKAEADAATRVVLEDYGHHATGRKPRQAKTPCWSWTSSRLWPRAWTRPSTWPSGSATSASRSSPPRALRASATTARRPACWPAALAGTRWAAAVASAPAVAARAAAPRTGTPMRRYRAIR